MRTMNEMTYEMFLHSKLSTSHSVGHSPQKSFPWLFDFQRVIYQWTVQRGRAAIFADCGMGKTPMQLAFSDEIHHYLKAPILILAPLAVNSQTIEEGKKFGIAVNSCRTQADMKQGINIANYEMMHHFEPESLGAIVLDESSILKSYTGKYRTELIERFQSVPYRLCCTATPAPNDYMELGNHAEFLGIMTRTEMLSTFFINDSGDTGTWRLKGHAEEAFWKWVASWSVMIRKPSDLGFDDQEFILPELQIHEDVIKSQAPLIGRLFHQEAQTLQERRQARRESLVARCERAAEIANATDEQVLVWCDLNDESALLTKLIDGAVEVKGADSIEHKEQALLDFSHGRVRVLVTKPKMAGFGMNWQNCHRVIFAGLSDSYEAYYQAVRRCWRFGQHETVQVWIITSELEGNVVENVKRKEHDAVKMAEFMMKHMESYMKENIAQASSYTSQYITDEKSGDNWKLCLGDSVELIKDIADNSIHYSIFSPPFASLFTFSASERDMGNCKTLEEFRQHFRFLCQELLRVIMPGRLLSFHCINLPSTIQSDGFIGMKDFRGTLIRLFEEVGFLYHSEVCIWKDPLVQAVRTKTLSLAHKQISKDSSRCGNGFPDYLVTMRKPGINEEPIAHGRGFERYFGERDEPNHPKNDNPKLNKYSHHVWKRYASPVWFDIRQTHTLNTIKHDKDEKHIVPLQLDVIRRALELWTNEGDVVFSPFAGIGSEGYVAIEMNRQFLGFELKPEYYQQSIKNIMDAERQCEQLRLIS